VVFGQWFGVGHVECGPADAVVPEFGDECVGVDDRSARDVDEDRIGPHRPERLGVDEPAGRLRERAREHHVLGVRAIASWNASNPYTSSVGPPFSGEYRTPTVSTSNGSSRSTMAEPIAPSPTTATVEPYISVVS